MLSGINTTRAARAWRPTFGAPTRLVLVDSDHLPLLEGFDSARCVVDVDSADYRAAAQAASPLVRIGEVAVRTPRR